MPPWNFFLIQALSGEIVSSKEATIFTPNGQQAVVLVSCAPISIKHDKQRILTGAIILFQDITKAKDIEQQKNEFLSIASHELRTPITIIQGFADLLTQIPLKEGSFDELTQSALMHIVDQSEYLTRLIDAMLDIARIEQQQLSLNLATHDLHHLLIQVVDSQLMTTNQHQLHLVVEGLQAHEPLPGEFDKQRIVQVMSNLINNAIKYSPNGGAIEVGLRVTHTGESLSGKYRDAWLWVKDHGLGIAPNECSRIFERFYRARMTDNSSLSGFGIGLYVTKEIINRHGGRVWVESRLHEGSTFYVHLPLHSPHRVATELVD
ncbi:sensor histidine kinase [Dictyobacter kobayashii]|uniref:sensor histidine kinase n=1 Tax=Dictyobacter kobayashii TaxID=2014872 RepID=UPI0013875AED|nr:HAMP domain-containing sensor histidine kinase [Dictyobacter kobayashii]